jgi:enoyl-CoA hydratase/carnithine racemase
MSDPVSVTVKDAVATVVISNPPVNAMSRALMTSLGGIAEELSASARVRAILVTASGTKAFLAGADVSEFEDIVRQGMAAHAEFACGVMESWASLPQPVVMCVQASAVGGGLEFALTGDVIIAAQRARIGLPEVGLGILPGGGGTQRLQERIGAPAARRLIMTAAIVDAAEAGRLGIVDQVVDHHLCLPTAEDLARRLAALPRLAVQAAKAATKRDLSHGLAEERRLFLSLTESADFAEGCAAFLAGRPGRFSHV